MGMGMSQKSVCSSMYFAGVKHMCLNKRNKQLEQHRFKHQGCFNSCPRIKVHFNTTLPECLSSRCKERNNLHSS